MHIFLYMHNIFTAVLSYFIHFLHTVIHKNNTKRAPQDGEPAGFGADSSIQKRFPGAVVQENPQAAPRRLGGLPDAWKKGLPGGKPFRLWISPR